MHGPSAATCLTDAVGPANARSLKRWTAFATPEVTPLLVTHLWMDVEVVHDLKGRPRRWQALPTFS